MLYNLSYCDLQDDNEWTDIGLFDDSNINTIVTFMKECLHARETVLTTDDCCGDEWDGKLKDGLTVYTDDQYLSFHFEEYYPDTYMLKMEDIAYVLDKELPEYFTEEQLREKEIKDLEERLARLKLNT